MNDVFKFHPFEEKDLICYLKGMNERTAHLNEMMSVFGEQIRSLDQLIVLDGYKSIEERIWECLPGGHNNQEGTGGVGKLTNPDALFNIWYKAYRPYEIERAKIVRLYEEYAFEQMKTECVMRCIYALPHKEKSVIEMVYIGHLKVSKYCNDRQIGHDTYGKIKRKALKDLRISVNKELAELYGDWNGNYAKNHMESRNRSSNSSSDSGRIHGTVSYRRLHRRAEKIQGVDR